MGCFDPASRTPMFRKDCKGDFRKGEDGAFYLWSRQNSWARAWAWVKHARFQVGLWQREGAAGRLESALDCLARAEEQRDLGRFRRRARRWFS